MENEPNDTTEQTDMEVSYSIEPSAPEAHFVNAPSRGKTERTVNGVRLKTRITLGNVLIGTLNSAAYVSENGDLDIAKPSAKVFSFSPDELARWKQTADDTLAAWDGLEKAYADALEAFKTPAKAKSKDGKPGQSATMARLRKPAADESK